MSQENSGTSHHLSTRILLRLLLGINIAFLAIALVSSLAFRSLTGLELLLWFLVCEALLFLVIFLHAFLFYWVWPRQKPSIAARQGLDALIDGISMLGP